MHTDAENAYTIIREQERELCIVPQNLNDFKRFAEITAVDPRDISLPGDQKN